jgi:hypothetical protein
MFDSIGQAIQEKALIGAFPQSYGKDGLFYQKIIFSILKG